MPRPVINVFISYAHADGPFFEVFKKEVKSHLKNSGLFNFNTWEDSAIPVGSNWHEEIQDNLSNSQLAILCVSSNFLNSKYIMADEYAALVNKYPDSLIVPVYFNHCNFSGNESLAIKQFFKPSGKAYDEENQEDFAFCDLVNFNKTNGALISNSNIDLYCSHFVNAVEKSLSTRYNIQVTVPEPEPETLGAALRPGKKNEKKLSDKIVEGVIVGVIFLSLIFIFYSLVLNKEEDFDSKKFNTTIGCTLFFGSLASFAFNKKLQHR
ncbi:MAG: TIR domain-containing protein [Ferruginibacter sp.]|nr:TIR domain-containing protein [Ferruginibacter sp.]